MAVEGVYPADGEDRLGMMEVVARKDVKARTGGTVTIFGRGGAAIYH